MTLIRALFQGTGSRPVHRFAGARICIAFRPGSQEVAIAVASNQAEPDILTELWSQDLAVDGQPPRLVMAEPFAGFWWSPPGERIAVLRPSDSGRYVVELRDPRGLRLVESAPFTPSGDYAQAATFCDQVGLAHWFWSSDGRSFLICGRAEGSIDREDAVFRWRPESGAMLERIGPGSFGSFRPPRLTLRR